MSKWMSFFDYEHGLITVLRNSKFELLKIDNSISDPERRFLVYVDSTGRDFAFRIKMKLKSNEPEVLHSAFNRQLLNSPTIWIGRFDPDGDTSDLGTQGHLSRQKVSSVWINDLRPLQWESFFYSF